MKNISKNMELPPGFQKDFFEAARTGDLPWLSRLMAEIEKGPEKISYASVKTCAGCNALHLAAAFGETEMCRHLIQNLKFEVDAIDDSGGTPLFQAVLGDYRDTVNFLIGSGANVMKTNLKGLTPLHWAAEQGYTELVKLLISKGADSNATSAVGTPLHCAAGNGSHETLKYLLDLKADPNSLSPIYLSPLLLSMFAESLECMELLLKAGADPNGLTTDTTPLCYAACKPDEKMIHCLLKAGANPNNTDFLGKTPLEHAALIGSAEGVKLLFPVTSRITCYPDWNITCVMQYVRSEGASAQRKIKQKEMFLMAKEKGAATVARKDYWNAIYWYSQAVKIDPGDAKMLSNRSLCFARLNNGDPALLDAQSCVALEPRWAKAHYREGAAWKVLKKYDMAAEAFSRALALDPGNKEIEDACREARALGFWKQTLKV
ncbi:OLC1v1016097C1 [Oldenlandia corymbosa var. corymbosa]|uniref:OLC1v1016097C1 n=1 Tax=Oldenlandia corymbosa var. corymbosa TaxID=529605 RepID=A0AAV1E7A6_OLDCO|nr:OLC1v1016097C1 [Oldenlandia corymbosa var. corymbosa]